MRGETEGQPIWGGLGGYTHGEKRHRLVLPKRGGWGILREWQFVRLFKNPMRREREGEYKRRDEEKEEKVNKKGVRKRGSAPSQSPKQSTNVPGGKRMGF